MAHPIYECIRIIHKPLVAFENIISQRGRESIYNYIFSKVSILKNRGDMRGAENKKEILYKN